MNPVPPDRSAMDLLPPFPGFRKAAFDFMRELAANNRREWFKARKQVFEDEVQWPLRCLVSDAARRSAAEDIPLRADPRRALFRIYRDTRFSKNKDPYKTAAGATLTRSGTHRDDGAVYIHMEPGRSFLGAGFWHPESSLLRRFRERMVSEPEAFLGVVHRLEEQGLELIRNDDMLKRMPRGFERIDDADLAPFLKYKSFTISRSVADEAMMTPAFTDELLDFVRGTLPLLVWGWDVVDGPGPG